MSRLLNVYRKYGPDIIEASGKYLYGRDGRKYLDFFSGISVNVLGNRSGKVLDSINEAASRYIHLSNLFREEYQEKLASFLVEKNYPGSLFFANSGAEAVECAIKSARKYFGGDRYEVISFKNSFHGRTLGAIAATGQEKFREGLGPMPPGFSYADFNFLASAEERISFKTCALLVEVIQGEGGVNVGEMEFIRGLRKICDEKGIFLIIDEVQTGLGRTGTFMAYEHYGIKPDIAVMGKALGGGLPLSAVILNRELSRDARPGDQGSTFGGNPVACAAGLAVCRAVDEPMLSDIRDKGDFFISSLKELKEEYPVIRDVRGRGLMIGVELASGAAEGVKYLLDKGVVANCTAENVLRFLPPYIIEKSDISEVVEKFKNYLKEKI